MSSPEWERVYYDDIDEIMRAKPSAYRVEEKHYPNGKFKSFTVTTQ